MVNMYEKYESMQEIYVIFFAPGSKSVSNQTVE